MGAIVSTESILGSEDAMKLQMHFAELEQFLAEDVPAYKNIMGTIHAVLRKNPAVVTMLTPEETALLIKGAETATGAFIAAKEAKKPSSRKNLALDL